MPTIRYSPNSPYVRKCRLVGLITGTWSAVKTEDADTTKGDAKLNAQNPLGKIPVLILDNGAAVYDSHVICEYLDSLHSGRKLFPPAGPARWDALTRAALADGVMDAALLLVYEKRYRPEEKWHGPWMDKQHEKIDRAVAMLNKAPPSIAGGIDYGHVAIACALGYLDFRHGGKWREKAPALVKWLDEFAAKVPAFKETGPVG